MDATLAALRDQVLAAGRDGRRLAIRGHGTKGFLGAAEDAEPLEAGAFRGVIDYDPAELVVTARGGTPLSALEPLLRGSGQYLAFEPPAFGGDPTLGGIVAAGLAGPRRPSAGAVREFVLGIKLLTSGGELLSFGGRVMKNVAGFDVARVVCGSYGTLGVIAEASLKVLPLPPVELTLALQMGAAEAVSAFNRWSRMPWPLSATCWHDGLVRVRLSGARQAVDRAHSALGGEALDPEAAARGWADVRDHRHPFLAAAGPLWRLSLPPTAPLTHVPEALLIEWAGGLRWLRSDAPAAELRAEARRAGGSAALWHGGACEPMHEPLPPPVAAIHRRLKDGLDPRGTFVRSRRLPEF